MLIYFKYEQKYLSKVSCSNFFPDPIFAVRFCIQEKVESSINNFKRRVFNSQSLFNGGFKFLTKITGDLMIPSIHDDTLS